MAFCVAVIALRLTPPVLCLEGIGVAAEIVATSGVTSGAEDEVACATAANGLAAGKAAVRGDVVGVSLAGDVATGGTAIFDVVAGGAAAGSVTASDVTTGSVAA